MSTSHENRKKSSFRKFRRSGLPYPNPGVRYDALDMSPVVGFTVAGRAPPPPDHVPVPPPVGDPSRALDVQMAAIQTEEIALALFSVPLILFAGALFWFGKIVAALLLVALIAPTVLATYYARRPHVRHRLARMLRAAFYTSFTYPGDKRPPRLGLRLSVIVVLAILAGLFGSLW